MKAVIDFLSSVYETFGRIITSTLFWKISLVIFIIVFVFVFYRKRKLHALSRLEYSRVFSSDGVFASESFEFTEILHNTTFFPLFKVKMEFFMPGGFTVDEVKCLEHTKVTSVFHIPPKSSVKKTHIVCANKRGSYNLETASICYAKNEFTFSIPFNIKVYPNCCGLESSMPPDMFRIGDSISKRKCIEDPFFISNIRPYRYGDPFSSVNFKASARSFSGGYRQLMCNTFDTSRDFDSMIIVNLTEYSNKISSFENEECLEKSLGYCCYLFSEILNQGGRVGFACNCQIGSKSHIYIPCSSGDIHVKNILDSIAEISYYGRHDCSINSILEKFSAEAPKNVDLYFITPEIDHKLSNNIEKIEYGGNHVCIIVLDN